MYKGRLIVCPATKLIVSSIFGLVMGLGGGCQSRKYRQNPATFLQTTNANWNKWLDEKIDVNVSGVPVLQINRISGLEGARYRGQGQSTLEKVITLKATGITRRDVFWRIHKQTGLLIDFDPVDRATVIRIRSREFVRLTEGL